MKKTFFFYFTVESYYDYFDVIIVDKSYLCVKLILTNSKKKQKKHVQSLPKT